jgi:hypothetical protein
MGENSGTTISTSHNFNPFFRGWVIGPVIVNADPAAGAWEKELKKPLWGWPRSGNTYGLLEIIKVGDGPAWTGWHENILTNGWEWVKGSIFAYTPTSPTGASSSMPFSLNLSGSGTWSAPKGFQLIDTGSISGDTIDFEFNPLNPNTWLLIYKTLEWDGEGRPSGPIRIAETLSAVPIPGAAWMLGAGLIGLVVIRRKNKQ